MQGQSAPAAATYTTESNGNLPDPGLPYSTYDVCVSDGIKHVVVSAVKVPRRNIETRARPSTVYLGSAAGLESGPMPMSDERGYTLVELLVGAMVSLVVLGAIMAMVQVATGNQNRVSEHVIANQRGRPAMNRIIDRLHSACVSPGPGAGAGRQHRQLADRLLEERFRRQPRSQPLRLLLREGKLTETTPPGTGTEPSDWTFGTPSSPVQLVDGVGTAEERRTAGGRAGLPLLRLRRRPSGDDRRCRPR